jgi:predicted flap endonuclease-1-like 5' DNA nuclease
MKSKITFTLPAANVIGAAGCVLLGDFNDWNLDRGIYLEKQPDGSMTAVVELAAGKDYQYRYLLSNGRWVNDDAEKITSELSGFPVVNCIVHVPAIAQAVKAPVGKTTNSVLKTKPKADKIKPAKVASKTAKPKPQISKDDLTKVEGIGKKIESLLNKNEIYSFKQLSKATVKTLKEILDAAGNRFSMHQPGTWPKQAKLAVEGKWNELETLQQQLKGGK